FAVRVPWPSSWRMPATSSRISASSSTIRISDDMAHLSVACGFADFGGSLFVGGTFGAEAQPGPSPSAVPVGSIIELDASAVLLDDAADDREPEAGPLLARRHIGLEQAVAVLLRQTGAVVDDVDNDVGPLACRRYLDPATAELFRRHRRDRLARVLDDVGQRLGDQPAVEARRHRIFRRLDFDVDVRMADAHQE